MTNPGIRNHIDAHSCTPVRHDLQDTINLKNEPNTDNDKSSYYDTDRFNKHINFRNIGISIFSLNIASLNKHKEELCCFLSSLYLKFDVIILSECRKNHSEFFQDIFPNYSMYSDLPDYSDFGGLVIFIKNCIHCIPRPDLKFSLKGIESVFLEITVNNKKHF